MIKWVLILQTLCLDSLTPLTYLSQMPEPRWVISECCSFILHLELPIGHRMSFSNGWRLCIRYPCDCQGRWMCPYRKSFFIFEPVLTVLTLLSKVWDLVPTVEVIIIILIQSLEGVIESFLSSKSPFFWSLQMSCLTNVLFCFVSLVYMFLVSLLFIFTRVVDHLLSLSLSPSPSLWSPLFPVF